MSVARMVDAVEVQLSTDFAGLCLEQDAGTFVFSGTYATSVPGALAMKTGTKYSDMDVRVECWDAAPPPPDDLWEDQDVLPWRSLDGASQAHLRGFDQVEGPVALNGFERARVEVLSWGRNRYGYGNGPDEPDEIPRERWLLRFWPDPDDLDALAGPPRRLIDREWLPAPRSGFHTATDALRRTGWWSALLNTPLHGILQALLYHDAAFRMEELPKPFLDWTWSTPVTRTHSPYGETGLESVSRAAGVEILTYQDALRALIALGVFATVQTPDGELLVPNPAPPIRAWEVVESFPETGYSSPRALEFEAYRTVSQDLLHLAGWAHAGVLRATPERIASRLGLSLDETLGALNFLAGVGHLVEPLPDNGIDTRSEIDLSPA